ncbi:MAG: transposase, partial [Candidatus Hodarchaeales archaeon]
PANVHQSRTAQELFDMIELIDLKNAAVFTADAAYDDKKTYARCVELGLVPVIDYNRKKSKVRKFDALRSSNWRKRCLGREGATLRGTVYRQRVAVERFQSTFKTILNGRAIPVRGLVKVIRHVYGVMFLTQLHAAINWQLQQKTLSVAVSSLLTYF